MAHSPERQELLQPSAEAASSTVEPQTSTKSDLPPSPTRSDKSSESEGRPVREKLKETRIDVQGSSETVPSSDHRMNDAPNGTATQSGDHSTSGSESERGRLRRKRSREDFEDDQEAEKHLEKKQERHARKKSRDVTSPKDSDVELPSKPTKTSIPKIDENDKDEQMHDQSVQTPGVRSKRQATPDATATDKEIGAVASPKNKRTRDQAENGAEASLDSTAEALKDSKAPLQAEYERDPKRPRDKSDTQLPSETITNKAKIPLSSGFSNTSSTSPFAAMSPKPQTSKAFEKAAEDLPQTSDDKFKASGFSSFTTSASPFGGISNPTSNSPFATTGTSKLTSFASSTATSTTTTTPSGFGALGNSSGKSAFGGSSLGSSGSKTAFGGTLGGSAFGGLGGTKTGLSSFATPGAAGITGLSQKPEKAFGAPADGVSESEEGSENDDDDTADNEDPEKGKDDSTKERRSSQPLLSQQAPLETGEEGEEPSWTGRAKLYTMAGEGGDRKWQERGTGPFKLNITQDEPKRARFVLRADGTHRLLLNAAVTKTMVFGDAQGQKPKDGRLLFNSPTANGELEMHLLRMKPDRGESLWNAVKEIQEKVL